MLCVPWPFLVEIAGRAADGWLTCPLLFFVEAIPKHQHTHPLPLPTHPHPPTHPSTHHTKKQALITHVHGPREPFLHALEELWFAYPDAWKERGRYPIAYCFLGGRCVCVFFFSCCLGCVCIVVLCLCMFFVLVRWGGLRVRCLYMQVEHTSHEYEMWLTNIY
jgi:hypothetical protein